MTAIHLSLLQPLKSKTGAAAMLRRIADADGKPVPVVSRALSIPDGGVTLTVDPGVYAVEACLPSGEVVSDQVAVAQGDAALEVRLASMSRTERTKRPKGWTADDVIPLTDSFQYPSASGQGDRSLDVGGGSRHVHLELFVLPHCTPREDWGNVLEIEASNWRHLSVPENAIAKLRDDHFEIRSPKQLRERCWSLVCVSGNSRFVSLPFEPVARSHARTIEVDVDAEHGVFRLVDDHIGVLCDYLATNSFGPAGVTIDEIADKLQRTNASEPTSGSFKRQALSGAIGACAVAYAATLSQRSDAWIDTISELCGKDWLPDGAVLAAHHQLFEINTQDSWVEAGRLFRTSLDRGIPYFSLGLNLLVDGLSVLASYDDAYEADLELVRTVARRANRGEAFTTLSRPLHA